jgi:ParB family chromosome partitioning protein
MNYNQPEKAKNADFLIVLVRDIRLIHDRPRRIMDPDAIERMKASMAVVGQLQPIGVRRDGNGWKLIFGYLRLHAAKQLGWKTIQAMEYPEAENTELVDMALWASENLHQSAPELDELSVMVHRLVAAGMSSAVTAQAIGKPLEWVNGMLGIAKDSWARELIKEGRLKDSDAWAEFSQLPASKQKIILKSAEPITRQFCQRVKTMPVEDRPNGRKSVQKSAQLTRCDTTKDLFDANEGGIKSEENLGALGLSLLSHGHHRVAQLEEE